MRVSAVGAADLVRNVLAHWRRERNTLRQGLVALSFLLGVTLVAGVILGQVEALLERVPGLLVLVPAAIGLRGAVFGALGARLGTGMLTGQFELRFDRGSFLRSNVEAALLLTVISAAFLGVLAWLSLAAFGLPSISLAGLVMVSMLGALLSSAAVLAAVMVLVRQAEARGWDMDAIGTPIISATADITTLPAVVLAALAVGHPVIETVVGLLALLAAGAALLYALRSAADAVGRITRESLPVLTYATVMGILAGTVLSARLDTLVTSPALLVAIPPFIATCGALGGILSARLASALHLGLLSPRSLPERPAVLDGTLIVLLGLVAFTAVGVLTQLAATVTALRSPGVASLIGVALIAGVLAITVVFFVSYFAATASYRFGLDPDNYGVPVVTASMDFLGILALVAAIAVVGVS